MTKAGEGIIAAAKEMMAIANGEDTGAKVHVAGDIDVKAIRKSREPKAGANKALPHDKRAKP